jgi:hypothetical protein
MCFIEVLNLLSVNWVKVLNAIGICECIMMECIV